MCFMIIDIAKPNVIPKKCFLEKTRSHFRSLKVTLSSLRIILDTNKTAVTRLVSIRMVQIRRAHANLRSWITPASGNRTDTATIINISNSQQTKQFDPATARSPDTRENSTVFFLPNEKLKTCKWRTAQRAESSFKTRGGAAARKNMKTKPLDEARPRLA